MAESVEVVFLIIIIVVLVWLGHAGGHVGQQGANVVTLLPARWQGLDVLGHAGGVVRAHLAGVNDQSLQAHVLQHDELAAIERPGAQE